MHLRKGKRIFQPELLPLFAGPLVLIIHNLEEAITMPAWVPEHSHFISSFFPSFVQVHFTSLQLYSSLLFATILPWIAAIGVAALGGKRQRTAVAILMNGIILLNVFIPHLFLTVLLFAYNPGLFTAVFLNFPVTFAMIRKIFRSGAGDGKVIRCYLLWSLILYIPVIMIIHYGGQLTEFFLRRSSVIVLHLPTYSCTLTSLKNLSIEGKGSKCESKEHVCKKIGTDIH